jgi:hypothetical protein
LRKGYKEEEEEETLNGGGWVWGGVGIKVLPVSLSLFTLSSLESWGHLLSRFPVANLVF